MIFGEKTRFAIECIVGPRHPKYAFGNICFWAANCRLGNYEQTIILWPAVSFISGTLRFSGHRYNSWISKANSIQTLEFIKDILSEIYSTLNQTEALQKIKENRECYQKFRVSPDVSEAFDGEFAILLDQNDRELLIWQDYETRKINEVQLATGEYEAVVQSFLDWILPYISHEPVVQRDDHLDV